MNATILNREFQHPADGWYMIEPIGLHPNKAKGIVQVIDAEAAQLIVNRFNKEAAEGSLSHGREMLIDHEHFKHDMDKETRAYGWLQKLENRADGIYAQIRWTTTGKAAVDGGDYRFFSTEYDPADLKVLNSAKPRRVRPMRLDGLTLTNNPNNKRGRPITNRNDLREDVDAPSAETKTKGRTMKSVCTLLGLSEDANESSVHSAVQKLLNRADITPDALKVLQDGHTALKTQNQTLLGEQVDALLDAHGVKEDKVRNRMRTMILPLQNREERIAALIDCGHKPVEAAKPGKGGSVVLNRGAGKNPGENQEQPSDEEETFETAAAKYGEKHKITNRLDAQVAFAGTKEGKELYAAYRQGIKPTKE